MYISTMAITKNIGEEELLQERLVLSKHQTKGLSFKPVFLIDSLHLHFEPVPTE